MLDKNTLLRLFNSSQLILSLVTSLWSCSLLFLTCLAPSLSVFLMLQSKKQHHHYRNHQICNPPQPGPSHSLSPLSRILSLVSAMAEHLSSTTNTTSNRWPPLSLSVCLYFYFSFPCFWLYVGCLGDWVQFGMWKSFDNLAWVWNLGHLSGCVCRSGKKESTKHQVENVAKGKEEGTGG